MICVLSRSSVAASRLPAGANVGAFDSGVYTFFLPRRVVNLDGVVNPGVQHAIDTQTLCRYMRGQHVAWFLDDRLTIPELRYFAKGVRVVALVDLSSEYRGRDRYPVTEEQVLAELDTSQC